MTLNVSETDSMNGGWEMTFNEVIAWFAAGEWRLPLIMLILTLGLNELARVYERLVMGVPFSRPRFKGYLYGEPIFVVIAWIMVEPFRRYGDEAHWYASWPLLLGLLFAGTLTSARLEAGEVLANGHDPRKGYTIEQELTPAKLVHTVCFGPNFALMLACAPILIAVGTRLEIMAVACCIGWFMAFNTWDFFGDRFRLLVLAHPHPSRNRQLRRAGFRIPV